MQQRSPATTKCESGAPLRRKRNPATTKCKSGAPLRRKRSPATTKCKSGAPLRRNAKAEPRYDESGAPLPRNVKAEPRYDEILKRSTATTRCNSGVPLRRDATAEYRYNEEHKHDAAEVFHSACEGDGTWLRLLRVRHSTAQGEQTCSHATWQKKHMLLNRFCAGRFPHRRSQPSKATQLQKMSDAETLIWMFEPLFRVDIIAALRPASSGQTSTACVNLHDCTINSPAEPALLPATSWLH